MKIDENLKNRLAGVAVVTVLAVIFLPMMFDDSVEKKAQAVSQLDIPHKPEVSPLLTTALLPDKKTELTAKPQPVPVETNTESAEIFTETPDTTPAVVDVEKPTKIPESVTEKKNLENDEVWEDPKPLIRQEKIVATKTHKKPQKTALPVLNPKYQEKTPAPSSAHTLAPLPNLEERPLPNANNRRWIVQVASLADETKANVLRDKLRAQGFSANVDSVLVKGKQMYRLKVGPELDSQQAQTTRTKINQLHNVHSIAIPE
jgi:cell division septation protein DedD